MHFLSCHKDYNIYSTYITCFWKQKQIQLLHITVKFWVSKRRNFIVTNIKRRTSNLTALMSSYVWAHRGQIVKGMGSVYGTLILMGSKDQLISDIF